ncbi:MAG: hypothetical protein A3G34_10025 [Candidatus Lindowbacteria bacterium RIFCSPLOWO2_12_FULL_62_27]|nr:MAG: hypothetical protein A3G34_10025 [Candidatus Lindowbacteria bacterium RIFCSPLOWO2_12_FULL_62_27]OGH61577.1 MAG: hypothetical protein A3I06_03035 [Candidatus Lindowbacteria bacterium RIFCSPLOWO2_02_FULL_62_12]
MSGYHLTRHAKNNLRLFRIDRSDVDQTIDPSNKVADEGKYTIYLKQFPAKYGGLPLKVVTNDPDKAVISAYPLKRGWKERT